MDAKKLPCCHSAYMWPHLLILLSWTKHGCGWTRLIQRIVCGPTMTPALWSACQSESVADVTFMSVSVLLSIKSPCKSECHSWPFFVFFFLVNPGQSGCFSFSIWSSAVFMKLLPEHTDWSCIYSDRDLLLAATFNLCHKAIYCCLSIYCIYRWMAWKFPKNKTKSFWSPPSGGQLHWSWTEQVVGQLHKIPFSRRWFIILGRSDLVDFFYFFFNHFGLNLLFDAIEIKHHDWHLILILIESVRCMYELDAATPLPSSRRAEYRIQMTSQDEHGSTCVLDTSPLFFSFLFFYSGRKWRCFDLLYFCHEWP